LRPELKAIQESLLQFIDLALFLDQLDQRQPSRVQPLDPDLEDAAISFVQIYGTLLTFLPLFLQSIVEETGFGSEESFVDPSFFT
jgi:hypothetical protein